MITHNMIARIKANEVVKYLSGIHWCLMDKNDHMAHFKYNDLHEVYIQLDPTSVTYKDEMIAAFEAIAIVERIDSSDLLFSFQDSRNIRDQYHNLDPLDIKAALQPMRSGISVVLINIKHNINIGSIIRSCNSFLVKDIYILGSKKFDRRGAVGTHHYENIYNISSIGEIEDISIRPLIGIDCLIERSQSLTSYKWEGNEIIVFGNEGEGIPNDCLAQCNYIVEIPILGSVRSLNVAAAAAIVLYDISVKTDRIS